MSERSSRDDAEPARAPSEPRAGPSPNGRASLIAVVAGLTIIGAILVSGAGRPSPGTATASSGSTVSASAARVALIDRDGRLATVDADGTTTVLGGDPATALGFPAWSPDGSRIAIVAHDDAATAIEIFAARPADPGPSAPAAPVVAYRSAEVPPFYLYWSPDGRSVSFLATEADGISLRVAPADGSGLPAGGPGSIIRRGEPLYFAWLAPDRLLVHVGDGPDAFLGEVGLDGAPTGPGLADSGDFRTAVSDASGRYLAFVRGQAPGGQLVVAARDLSAEHAAPILGPAAMVFDPTGPSLASIAADEPERAALGFPIGPLRLTDAASGAARTLLPGDAVGFFWSPDGRTIAALRLQQTGGGTVAARSIVPAAALTRPAIATADSSALTRSAFATADASAPPAAGSPTPAPTGTPAAGPRLHLVFVNVADGAIRSDRIVDLDERFIHELLPYFDQYALSHRIWAPDSSAILLPLVDDVGSDRLTSIAPAGATTRTFDGTAGFWSP